MFTVGKNWTGLSLTLSLNPMLTWSIGGMDWQQVYCKFSFCRLLTLLQLDILGGIQTVQTVEMQPN